jgi:hypothetical protein
MRQSITNELLECPDCGARIALGKYLPLQRWGKPDCKSDLREVPLEEADRLLDELRRSKP